jgi:hypothetical protein
MQLPVSVVIQLPVVSCQRSDRMPPLNLLPVRNRTPLKFRPLFSLLPSVQMLFFPFVSPC